MEAVSGSDLDERGAERPALEPNQRNSLNFNAPRGLQFTLGLQFGYRDLRGIFAKMHRNSLRFTAIFEFLKSAGFEPKPVQITVCLMTRPHHQPDRAIATEGTSYIYHAVKLHFTLRNCSDSQLTQCQRLVGKYDQMSFR